MNSLLDISVLDGPFVVAVYALAGVLFVILLVVRPSRRWSRRRWLATALLSLVVGAAVGAGLTWLLGDALRLFGADFTVVVRIWIAVTFATIALAVVSMRRAWWLRVVASCLALVVFAVAGAMSVNIDFGQYPTVRSVLGISSVADNGLRPVPTDNADEPTIATWKAPADMPDKGTVTSTTIPATVSGFPARPGVVYYPPAALTENPPRLPVLIMLSGQPGTPEEPLVAVKLQENLDLYAAAHQGLAPIVVSPDQLGDPSTNPMCVDSPLGNSATYLTVDVPNWIKANLPVLDGPEFWGIGGFSQGGTCSIQLGAGFPQLFGTIIDASGEDAPQADNPADAIATAFGGDTARYDAARPADIMAAHAPYTDTFAFFGVGADDDAYRPGLLRVFAAAQAAGMTATSVEVPDSGHDATAWSAIFKQGMTLAADRWGLNR